MRVVGASGRQMLREVYLPALLPVPLMALALYGLRSAVHPSSIAGVITIAAVGAAVYAGAYLGMTAPADDRDAGRRAVATLLRFGGQRADAVREQRRAAKERGRT